MHVSVRDRERLREREGLRERERLRERESQREENWDMYLGTEKQSNNLI